MINTHTTTARLMNRTSTVSISLIVATFLSHSALGGEVLQGPAITAEQLAKHLGVHVFSLVYRQDKPFTRLRYVLNYKERRPDGTFATTAGLVASECPLPKPANEAALTVLVSRDNSSISVAGCGSDGHGIEISAPYSSLTPPPLREGGGYILLETTTDPTKTDTEENTRGILELEIKASGEVAENRFDYRDGQPISEPSLTMQAMLDALTSDAARADAGSVRLSIDRKIQAAAVSALEGGGGAIVVIDPQSGDVLALASRSADGKPGIADALAARVPGAAFLPVTALAGIPKELADRTFECSGSVQYGDHVFKCWKADGHGKMTLADALKVSCGAFFYQYGNAAGAWALADMGASLGLGKPSGIPLEGDQSGIMPSVAWLAEKRPAETWSDGYTANVSIGQGSVAATPLQMAVVAAAIASEAGIVRVPRLVLRAAPEGESSLTPSSAIRGNLNRTGVTADGIGIVRSGMWRNANESQGTGREARLDGAEVAGRTGTSQDLLPTEGSGEPEKVVNGWFIGFAPYRNPRVAVCVLRFDADSGGRDAAPIAAELMRVALGGSSVAAEERTAPTQP